MINELCDGHYAHRRTIAYRIMRHDYYWPNLQKYCIDHAYRCDRYQRYANVSYLPASEMKVIVNP